MPRSGTHTEPHDTAPESNPTGSQSQPDTNQEAGKKYGEQAILREPKTGQFAKGSIANPRGRPTKAEAKARRSYLESLRQRIEENPEPLADAVYRRANKGDIRAHTFIRDTLYGTPTRTIQVLDNEGPLAGLLAGIAGQIVEGEVRELSDGETPITG